MLGFATLLIGVLISATGMIFFSQVYGCLSSLGTTCLPDATNRFAWAFPLVIFGGYLIILGGLGTIAGYIVMELAPTYKTNGVRD